MYRLPDELLTQMSQGLRYYRQYNKSIPTSTIEEIVALMVKDEDMCSCLCGRAFGIILDVLLQSDISRAKERGLYLLAVCYL